jgi:hypothetical protein
MIGVETIQTIQIIMSLQASTSYFNASFFNFKNLGFAYGQISTIFSAGQTIGNKFYSNLGYESNMNHNYLIFSFINGIIILVFLIVRIIGKVYSS